MRVRPSAGLAALACALCLAPSALAQQFDSPGSTSIREKITGDLNSATGAPTPESGDQIGVFFQNKIVGLFTYTGANPAKSFSITIFGDDTATTAVEGPKVGQAVELRFFDSSANQSRTDLRFENTRGEAFNYRYAGAVVPPLPVDLPGLDLTPTRNLNIRIGVATPGGGGGGPDPTAKNKFDVDANGKVDVEDAAMVLQMVTGVRRGLSAAQIARADVTGDGKVDTNDAIEILRNR